MARKEMTQNTESLEQRLEKLELNYETWADRAKTYGKTALAAGFAATATGVVGVGALSSATTYAMSYAAANSSEGAQDLQLASNILFIGGITCLGLASLTGAFFLYHIIKTALASHQAYLLDDQIQEIEQSPEYKASQAR